MDISNGNMIKFRDEHEFCETLGFLCKPERIVSVYVEHNKDSGAWSDQGRMKLSSRSDNDLPAPLEEAFSDSKDGRISETRFVERLRTDYSFSNESVSSGKGRVITLFPSSVDDVKASIPKEYHEDFDRGYNWICSLTKKITKSTREDLNYENETVCTFESRPEGKKKAYYTTRYERDPRNRKEAIRIHGTTCNICGFDFKKTYGELGDGYIEVHHIVPLSDQDEEAVVDPATDLISVCANCHRMLHRYRDYIVSISELESIVESNKEAGE